MSEHTPGPWHAAERGDGVDSEALREDDGQPALAVLIEVGRPADAHLIAAAPELLAVAHVARRMARMVDRQRDAQWERENLGAPIEEIMEQIDAAIAKAKGRE